MLKKLLLLLPCVAFSQGFTSFFTGNSTNLAVQPSFGVCMMGGMTENDDAMIWFLQKANGGDVVVVRSSGSDGYNNYMYSGLGVQVNSVETLVITSAEGATHPYVLDKIAQAEAIWFAGGNQANYINFFKDNTFEDAMNHHINVKQGVVGGTSAGMAILGEYYFSAISGSVTSSQALSNPFHQNVTIDKDFLSIPFLENVITDTHYNNPDRRGRHTVFMARIAAENNVRAKGIACDEFVAVCIDENGVAKVFGDFPQFQDFAYFIQVDCEDDFLPQTLVANQPLTWNNNGVGVRAYKLPATGDGTNQFDLNTWETGVGGTWEHWTVNSGVLSVLSGEAPDCVLSNHSPHVKTVGVYPNPFREYLHFQYDGFIEMELFDLKGIKLHQSQLKSVNLSHLPKGLYVVNIRTDKGLESKMLVKE